ncbi:hypothetical protein [Pedobacter xixiisoli]|nr:hypothetical protein [Pedobacter xixiisoli]
MKDIFSLVDKNNLENAALKFGFKLANAEENILPNGKELHTYEFEKNT